MDGASGRDQSHPEEPHKGFLLLRGVANILFGGCPAHAPSPQVFTPTPPQIWVNPPCNIDGMTTFV